MSGSTPRISRVKGAVQVREMAEFCTVIIREPTAERRPVRMCIHKEGIGEGSHHDTIALKNFNLLLNCRNIMIMKCAVYYYILVTSNIIM